MFPIFSLVRIPPFFLLILLLLKFLFLSLLLLLHPPPCQSVSTVDLLHFLSILFHSLQRLISTNIGLPQPSDKKPPTMVPSRLSHFAFLPAHPHSSNDIILQVLLIIKTSSSVGWVEGSYLGSHTVYIRVNPPPYILYPWIDDDDDDKHHGGDDDDENDDDGDDDEEVEDENVYCTINVLLWCQTSESLFTSYYSLRQQVTNTRVLVGGAWHRRRRRGCSSLLEHRAARPSSAVP